MELTATGSLHPRGVTAGSIGPVKEAGDKTLNTKLSLDLIKPAS